MSIFSRIAAALLGRRPAPPAAPAAGLMPEPPMMEVFDDVGEVGPMPTPRDRSIREHRDVADSMHFLLAVAGDWGHPAPLPAHQGPPAPLLALRRRADPEAEAARERIAAGKIKRRKRLDEERTDAVNEADRRLGVATRAAFEAGRRERARDMARSPRATIDSTSSYLPLHMAILAGTLGSISHSASPAVDPAASNGVSTAPAVPACDFGPSAPDCGSTGF